MSGNTNGTRAPTKDDSARVQSAQAKQGHNTGKGSFPARIQSAADKNTNNTAGKK